jgi:hypothetical protein
LDACIEPLLRRLDTLAAQSADLMDLMAALVPIIEIRRYGSVRQTDQEVITTLAEGLLARICVGLPYAATGLDDDTSLRMFELMRGVHEGVRLMEQPSWIEQWHQTLLQLSRQTERVNPIIVGCTVRLLLDARILDDTEAAQKFALALSTGQEPAYSAGWIEGFLSQSGMVLLYDPMLWDVLHQWVASLPEEQFTTLLPILRRTFAKYEPAERQKIGEKARKSVLNEEDPTASNRRLLVEFDTDQAADALALTGALLG